MTLVCASGIYWGKTASGVTRWTRAWWTMVVVNTLAWRSRAVHGARVKEGLPWPMTAHHALTLTSVIYLEPAVISVGTPGDPTSASVTPASNLELTTSHATVSYWEGKQMFLMKKAVFRQVLMSLLDWFLCSD